MISDFYYKIIDKKTQRKYKKLNKKLMTLDKKSSEYDDAIIKKIKNFQDSDIDKKLYEILTKNDALTKILKILEETDTKEDLQAFLANISEKTTPFIVKIDSLIKQKELLLEIEKLLQTKKNEINKAFIELRQQEIELKEEDLYNRMRVFKSQNHYFLKGIIIVCIILSSVFVGSITSSIKKRIEYNPYENVQKQNFFINNLADKNEQNNSK